MPEILSRHPWLLLVQIVAAVSVWRSGCNVVFHFQIWSCDCQCGFHCALLRYSSNTICSSRYMNLWRANSPARNHFSPPSVVFHSLIVTAVFVCRYGSNVIFIYRYDCVVVSVVLIAHGGDNFLQRSVHPDAWVYGGQTISPAIVSYHLRCLLFAECVAAVSVWRCAFNVMCVFPDLSVWLRVWFPLRVVEIIP